MDGYPAAKVQLTRERRCRMDLEGRHLPSSEERKAAFELISQTHSWGGTSRSGPGSDPGNIETYVGFINRWLSTHPEVRRVVEVGCGDWTVGSRIALGQDRSYVGYDIVSAVIDDNRQQYGSDRVRFECADAVANSIESGDVLIAKDVLQHLSNDSISAFLTSHVQRFQYCVLTNDIKIINYRKGVLGRLRPREVGVPNQDIADGGGRSIDLCKPPFSLVAAERMSYKVTIRPSGGRVVFVKDVVVVDNRQQTREGAYRVDLDG